MDLIYSFEPVFETNARILILGTMPSVASLKMEFYYAHPQNSFWRVISQTLGVQKPVTIDEKKAMLIKGRIALWDAARSCERVGSLDSNIKNVVPNDIPGLIDKCPEIERILFNGQKARELYNRFYKSTRVESVTLPSTSPANTLSYYEKLDAWSKAITLEGYNERY